MLKHKKPKTRRPGRIIKQEGSLDASNVMVVCPKCSKATRVGHKIEDGKKPASAKMRRYAVSEGR